MRKLIIDTDPGIDDALALMACFQRADTKVLGVTTVAGNKGIKYTTVNATKLIRYFDYPCKVYQGAQRPLKPSKFIEEADGKESAAGDIHGSEGLGSAVLPSDLSLIEQQTAVDFILDQVRSDPGNIDILALGPLTNIALAIQQDVETMKKVKSIYTMGGAVWKGNVTPVAEFNYWFDPDAVQIVYSQLGSQVPIYMIGLDLTHQLCIDHNELFIMREDGGELGEIINQMLGHYARIYWQEQKILGVVIHDLTAALCYLDPEIVEQDTFVHLDCQTGDGVARGQCVCDMLDNWGKPHNAHIILQVNEERYKQCMYQGLFGEEVAQKHFNLHQEA